LAFLYELRRFTYIKLFKPKIHKFFVPNILNQLAQVTFRISFYFVQSDEMIDYFFFYLLALQRRIL